LHAVESPPWSGREVGHGKNGRFVTGHRPKFSNLWIGVRTAIEQLGFLRTAVLQG